MTEPDGPGPDDRLRRRVLWAMPTGLYVVGSRAGDERNLMTANLVVQVATEPRLVAVAVEAGAVTSRLIAGGAGFALSMLSPEDKAVVRRFVKPVPAADVDLEDGRAVSMRGEPVVEGPSGIPVLARAVAWLECALRHSLSLGSHVLFVGEVTGAGGPGDGVPTVLAMSDTRMSYGG